MGLDDTYYKILVEGEQTDVIKMLNVALKNLGSISTITKDDDAIHILELFKDKALRYSSFLDMENNPAPYLIQKRDKWMSLPNNEEFDEEVETYLWVEDIRKKGDKMEVELHIIFGDYFGYFLDWANGGDVLTQHPDVVIYTDIYWVRNVFSDKYTHTVIYRNHEGQIEEKDYSVEHLDELIRLLPLRYIPIKIEILQKEINDLQWELEKMEKKWEELRSKPE